MTQPKIPQLQPITAVQGIPRFLIDDNIDTDRIIPARFLRCTSFDQLGQHAFADDRAQDPDHPFNTPPSPPGHILITGVNFGCGSSREHAPQALKRWGINAIIAVSFAEIFRGNCLAIGLPCLTASQETIRQLAAQPQTSGPWEIDVSKALLHTPEQSFQLQIHPADQQALLAGNWNALINLLQAKPQIQETATRLPYLRFKPASPNLDPA